MATSKSTAKRPATKKAPAKRSTTTRTTKASAQSEWELPSGGNYKTFKAGKDKNFFSFRITDQTIYWAILCFIVLALGIWVITINDKVQHIYDQIDQDNTDNALVVPKKS